MTQVTIDQAIQIALEQHRAGRLAEAEAIYRQVLAQVPDHGDALQLLGILAGQSGHVDVAIDLLLRVIAREPTVAAHHHNLGQFYRRNGELDLAIASLRRAIALGADDVRLHGDLGSALYEAGRFDEAITTFRRAAELRGDDAIVFNNLGLALDQAGQLDLAIAALERATVLDPGYAEAYANLGAVWYRSGRLDPAIAACRRGLELQPGLAEAHNNLGNALREAGQIDLAIAAYRAAVIVKPRQAVAWNNLLLTLHFDPNWDGPKLLEMHRLWAARFAGPLAAEITPHAIDRVPGRRLRVGFVSPDFRDHPAGGLVRPLFRHHDRRQAAFIAYSDVKAADSCTAEFQALADEYQSIVGLSDAAVAERVRGDRIDILVDLAVHTAANRLLVFARKPAPVQVSMLGMPATTGLSTIDYRLTDSYFDPPGAADGHYSERAIRLPRSIYCYEPPAEAPAVGPLPAGRNGFITFGCLNQLAKVSPPALEVWIRILQSLPGARLILQSAPGSHLDRLRRRFQEGDIAPDRVEFVAKAPRGEYLRRYLDLDLSLDPFPYNGHTSSFDTLWMGVPLITLAGRTGVGRAGVSVLSNLGLSELIAGTPEEYVAIARALAGDLARMAGLRSSLRQRMQASPLLDGSQFAADVDAAFRRIWQTWCNT